jgi:hypothetical protein
MVFVRLGKASSVIPEHVPWRPTKLQFAANAPAVALEVKFDVLMTHVPCDVPSRLPCVELVTELMLMSLERAVP